MMGRAPILPCRVRSPAPSWERATSDRPVRVLRIPGTTDDHFLGAKECATLVAANLNESHFASVHEKNKQILSKASIEQAVAMVVFCYCPRLTSLCFSISVAGKRSYEDRLRPLVMYDLWVLCARFTVIRPGGSDMDLFRGKCGVITFQRMS